MKSNRYVFFKRCFPKYLIFFSKNGKLTSYSKDKEMVEYLKLKDIKILRKLHINYLILNNVNIIEKHTFKYNNYYIYYKRWRLNSLLEKISNKHNIEKYK